MNKLLLVDGHNLLFQMFYGMPSRIVNAQGKAIHGTLGFVGALLKIIRRVLPTHILVLFDGEHPNPRTALDAAYKANRPDYSSMPEEETPFSQLPDVYAALDFLHIAHTETTTCETDDVIAAYALSCAPEMDVVISSFDSDFFQLVSPHVSVLRYRGDATQLVTPETIAEKFGITPAQYADFKSLTGDQADHIRGADKIGPKTAAQLLHTFGTLEGVLRHADEIAKPSIRESIQQNADRLRLNQQLITLTGCAALPIHVESLACAVGSITTREVLRGIGLQ